MEILDLTIRQEITSEGPSWSGTVCRSPDPKVEGAA
jgi:hypothetical protein